MVRFSPLWLAIFIIFPFVWQRCNLFNLDQLISTLSPNGIILNTYQLNPPLSITETTYIGFCDAFPDSSLPIGLFGWLLWGLFLFQLAYRSSLVDYFGAFADFSLLFDFFGWLLWGLFLFQLAFLSFKFTLHCILINLWYYTNSCQHYFVIINNFFIIIAPEKKSLWKNSPPPSWRTS